MSRRSQLTLALACILVAGLAAGKLRAQQGACEVRGSAKDGSKKGIAGVRITLANTKQANLTYSRETDKRGDFWFSGVAYDEVAREWRLSAEKEGFVPLKARVEIRASDKTLVQEFETKLGRDSPAVQFPVRAFGEVRVDITLVAESEAAAAVAPSGAPAGEAAADPFAQALDSARRGDLEGSVKFFEAAVEAAPDDPERREAFAKVLYRLDRIAEAEAQAGRAAAVAPERASAHLLHGDLLAARGEYARAAEAFARARSLEPDNVSVLERVAWVANETGQLDEAIAANEAIVARTPEKAEAWAALGDLYSRKGRPDKAEQAYRKVVELDPKNAYKTFFNIGVLIEGRPRLTDADNRKAVEAFRKAIEIEPGYAPAHRHLAYALLRAGDLEGAKGEFSTYLRLAPDAADAAEIRAMLDSLGSAGKRPTK